MHRARWPSSFAIASLVTSLLAAGGFARHGFAAEPVAAFTEVNPGQRSSHARMRTGPTQDVPARGVVRAVRQAALSTELQAPVAELPLREGERFAQGQMLVVFDCRRQRHEHAALAANLQEMKIAVETNRHLASRGAANLNDVAIAKARHDKAEAEWSAMSVRLAQCTIAAPFDGVVTELGINAHEIPQANRPFMSIASDRLLEIEIIVPSRQLPGTRAGQFFTFTIDETGVMHRARVIRTGGAVDPVSQTVKIYGQFADGSSDVLPGMSGTASLGSDR